MWERINSNIWASQSWSVAYMFISDILCCTLAVSLHGRNLLTWATFLVEFNFRVVPSFLFPKNLRCVYWLFLKLIWGSTLKTEIPPQKNKKIQFLQERGVIVAHCTSAMHTRLKGMLEISWFIRERKPNDIYLLFVILGLRLMARHILAQNDIEAVWYDSI